MRARLDPGPGAARRSQQGMASPGSSISSCSSASHSQKVALAGSSSTAVFSQGRASPNWPSRCKDQPEVGVGQGQFGFSRSASEVGGPGVDEPLEHPQHVAQVVVQHRQSSARGGPPPGSAAAPLRPGRGPAASGRGWSGPAAKAGSSSTARRKCDQRLVGLAQLAQRDAQVVVGHDEVRPQLQRAAELLDGLGVPAQALQGRTQVAEASG